MIVEAMEHDTLQQEIRKLQGFLFTEMEAYRRAINESLDVNAVMTLYRKLKRTLQALRLLTLEYEQQNNKEIEMYNRRHLYGNPREMA